MTKKCRDRRRPERDELRKAVEVVLRFGYVDVRLVVRAGRALRDVASRVAPSLIQRHRGDDE